MLKVGTINYMPPEAIKDMSSSAENGKSRSKVIYSSYSSKDKVLILFSKLEKILFEQGDRNKL